jgi:hypothetical protein
MEAFATAGKETAERIIRLAFWRRENKELKGSSEVEKKYLILVCGTTAVVAIRQRIQHHNHQQHDSDMRFLLLVASIPHSVQPMYLLFMKMMKRTE